MVGRRLAHYKIDAHLGSGGMGDVYRATDTKLGRSVALKFLQPAVSHDARRAARFRREARALAALNHPHIAAIYGEEEADGQSFLVMEYVPGETLDERLRGRPLPLDEALSIARQISEALESAHEHGIVHRDLKPANVKITPDGRVKVLDFGLAKAVDTGADGLDAEDRGQMTTVTMAHTGATVIVGTPAYMAPEQAKGLAVDHRADIFSFGSVLFEMLTVRPAFGGGNAAEILSRVLQRDPEWTLLPAAVPRSIRRLLRLCLEKDPRRRKQSAGDVRIDLEHALDEPELPEPQASGERRTSPARTLLGATLLVLVTVVATVAAMRLRDAPLSPLRLEVTTPPTLDPMQFAISPNGRSVAYLSQTSVDAPQRLYLRRLDQDRTTAHALAGTDGAQLPFWAPDSKAIGFFAGGRLYRIDIAGGPPQVLAPAANPQGGAWGADGTILFAPTTATPLFRVPASGGDAVPATILDVPRQSNHRRPSFLPDGRRFLFYAVGEERPGLADVSGIYLGSLDGGEAKRLASADSGGAFLEPDLIVFLQEGSLVARRADLARGELLGDPLVIQAPSSGDEALSGFSISAEGVIAYRAGRNAPRRTTWFDRSGTVLKHGSWVNAPSFSRDGRYLAHDRFVDSNRDVWITDLARGGSIPLTRHPAIDGHPVWSPDDATIAFESQRSGRFEIWTKPSSGAAPEVRLHGSADNEWPLDWSRDGRFLLYQRTNGDYMSADLLALPLTGSDRTPIEVAATPFEERLGSLSPDSRWVAYETDESGRPGVVVTAFPRSSGAIPVSTDGGTAPRWSADGKEIYFISAGKMMAVAIESRGPTLTLGKPTVVFAAHFIPQLFTFQYAVTRDGQFLVNDRTVEHASASPIMLILNWRP